MLRPCSVTSFAASALNESLYLFRFIRHSFQVLAYLNSVSTKAEEGQSDPLRLSLLNLRDMQQRRTWMDVLQEEEAVLDLS